MDSRPVAVVTGASRGIGRAIALDLAGAGFDIAGVDLALESTPETAGLDGLAAGLADLGAAFLPIEADISRLEGHGKIVSDIEEAFGRVDALVNNAGIAPLERKDVLETTPESFDRVIAVNLRGTFFLTQAIAGRMIASAEGEEGFSSIIFITSISAEVSSVNRVEYCVSKAGLSMVARVFADRLVEHGIRVYEVRPGIIETDMTAPVKEKYDRLIAGGLVPLGRWGQPEDIARVVTSLARGDLGYSTGTIIEASGGMHIRSL